MPQVAFRHQLIASLALILTTTAGCAHGRRPASYLPVGASAWYGDGVADGVPVILSLGREAATRAVVQGLRAAGYQVLETQGEGGHTIRTAARPLTGDTTLTIAVQISPVELPAPGATLVLTGRYSVPGQRLRDAPVLQRRGERNPLYQRLREVADTIRAHAAR